MRERFEITDKGCPTSTSWLSSPRQSGKKYPRSAIAALAARLAECIDRDPIKVPDDSLQESG
jgi:hypothetical protein